MSTSISFDVLQFGKYPSSRQVGREGRASLDDLLETHPNIDVTIDFSGVEVMNISFVDEFVGKFLTSHDFAAEGATIKVAGLNSDNRYSLLVAVERREAEIVVVDDSGNLELIGDKILAETFQCALDLFSFKANDLAAKMTLTAQNANNRLKRLAKAGAVRKTQVTGSARGGREFEYEALPVQLPAPA